MKKICSLFVLSLFLLAAGGGSLDKANGRWECDVDATLAVNKQAQEESRRNPKAVRDELAKCALSIDVAQKTVVTRSGKGEGRMDFTIISDSGTAFTLKADGQRQKFSFTPEGKLVLFGALPESDMVFRRAR